ncbi:hypothetical protein MTP99_009820 [Tenebrio molitor]|jgi:hypothetical protein|nr:hypothetical protein MTP99_009820 [Tenebrio molitor]
MRADGASGFFGRPRFASGVTRESKPSRRRLPIIYRIGHYPDLGLLSEARPTFGQIYNRDRAHQPTDLPAIFASITEGWRGRTSHR